MGRKRRMGMVAIGFLGISLIMAGIVFPAPPDNYTAQMSMGGMTMPMAKMGDKTRIENPMMQGLVTITYKAEKKTIMLSVPNKAFLEQPLQERTPNLQDPDVVAEKKKIGSEKVDGHPCTKYDVVFYRKEKPDEKFKAVVWEAEDLGGLPIRQEIDFPEARKGGAPGKVGGPGKMVIEMKEIKVGGARASMFEVPKDFKKVSSMPELMGGVGKMMEQMKKK
jgi:hypothetical protein